MNKLFPIIFIPLLLLSWVTSISGLGSGTREYETCLSKAKAAYEKEYYVEALNWLGQARDLSDTGLTYKAAALIRDSYLGLGEIDSYLSQCHIMIQDYPQEEENYTLLVSYYVEHQDFRPLSKCLPDFLESWPENETLKKAQQMLDTSYEYVQTGYYDVQYATGSLVDIRKLEYTQTDGEQQIERTLCSSNGSKKFDIPYQEISVSQDNYSCFIKDQDGLWSRVNASGQLLARNKEKIFSSIGRLALNNIAKAVIDGRTYFINDEMKVSNISWEDAGTFSEGINAVKEDGKWALVTSDSWTSEDVYPYLDIPRNSMDVCCVDGRIVTADEQGYRVLDAKEFVPVSENVYEELKAFESSQPTAYRQGNKWGFVNRNGQVYLEAAYEDAKPFLNGYAAVKENGLWGFIDRNDVMVVKPQFTDALNVLPDGTAYVRNEQGYWDYIVITKLRYENEG